LTSHKDILIKYSMEKSLKALETATKNLDIDLTVSQNRAYYAVFYIVLALAYSDGFATGSHHKLLGWFNKKYVYENKIFEQKLSKIYSKLLSNRETFDYSVIEYPELLTVKNNIEEAKLLVNTVKNYILSI
jgi:uncharacterized protein (UPF0332 family)